MCCVDRLNPQSNSAVEPQAASPIRRIGLLLYLRARCAADSSCSVVTPRNTVRTAFAAKRDYASMCGRYGTLDEAAMERAYNLAAMRSRCR